MIKKIALLLATLSSLLLADTLSVRNEKKEGMFSGYEKNKLQFQEWEAEKLSVYDTMSVARLKMDAPVEAQLYLNKNDKAPQTVKVLGFNKQKFQLEINGEKKAMAPRQMYKITVKQDIASFMARRDAAMKKNAAEEAESGNLADMLEQGKVTAIHFHCDGGPASQRQGGLLERLCKESKGKAVYKRIDVADMDDPLAAKYKLTSLPQFWFFTKNKKVSAKLADRFSEEDIEKALKNAIRGK